MTVAVLWIKYTLGFILITLLLQKKMSFDSVEECEMSWVVLWTKYSHGFILITLLFKKKLT